jgi:hypothetical protein
MIMWRDQASKESIDGSAEKGQEVTSQKVLLLQGRRTTAQLERITFPSQILGSPTGSLDQVSTENTT